MSTTAASISSKHQPIRPPTPPLDNETDFDLEACETGLELLNSKNLVYNTPDDSPNSTTELMGKSPEERSAKRVDFVLIPAHIGRNARQTNRLEELKPKRSILKQSSIAFSSDPPSSDIVVSVEEEDFPAMLEHMIRGLASQDISARYDAYMSMNGCLKTYDDTPSKNSLAEKMSKLDGFIRRDLAIETSVGVRASQMVTETLKFVTSLCWFPETRSVMTAGFQVFLLNHAITVLGKEDTPKVLANLYLYFLSIQCFPQRVMNQEKVVRILSVLKGVAERVQGRQSAAHRLAIYKRLIGQAKSTMASRAGDWVEDMFNNVISKSKEVRERAIALGFSAAHCYGSESDSPVSDALRRLMNSKRKEGETTYIDDVIARLQGWLDSKQDIAEIPSIWSIVILLLRSKRHFPERWEHLARWLKLIQGCLNINDPKTRSEANLAWIRLIYTISPDSNTPNSFSSLLFRPMKKQLERQEREKDKSGQLRKNVDSAYVTLLYYAFRPGSDHASLDRYWDDYIVPVFCQNSGLPIGESVACQILTSLFGSKQQVWQANRALDTTNVLSPAELTRADPKWLRSRAKKIMSVLTTHLHKLKPNEDAKDSNWKGVWSVWLDAIKLASAKEVKVSSEAMLATTEMVNLYRKATASMTVANADVLSQVTWIVSYLHEQLGSLPFLEERILDTDGDADLEVVIDRTKHTTGTTRSALTILNKSTISMLDRLDWSSTIYAGDSLPQSLVYSLSTATRLLQAGFKSLSVEVRHGKSGQKYSQMFDALQQNGPYSKQPQELAPLLLDFVKWFDKIGDGIMPTEDIEEPIESAQIETPEDTIVLAVTRPIYSKRDEEGHKHQRNHKVHTKELITARPTTPDTAARRRRAASLAQQPRMRHDNSQIEFASIDSSPSILKAMDSQLMTDRQKEVKERQVAESDALFRDISSSSGTKSRKENTPRLQLSGRDRALSERPGSSSPIPVPEDSMQAMLGSSPTPSQRRSSYGDKLGLDMAPASSSGTSMMHFTLDDPPSSPPAEAEEMFNEQRSTDDTKGDTSPDNAEEPSKDTTAEDRFVEEPAAMPPHFLSSVADQSDTNEALVPLDVQDFSTEDALPQSSSPAQELEMVDALRCTQESEDDDLISSQIDRDLKHASQDMVIVKSPTKQKQISSQDRSSTTPKTKSRKRASPGLEDEAKAIHPVKRIRLAEGGSDLEPSDGASQDIVAQLETFLGKAKAGMTLQQGLAILKMSAELTQLAVQAVQGGTTV